MAGDDQAVDNARMSSRPLPQGFCGPDRIHLHDAGAEEILKPAQRRRLRNIVMMRELPYSTIHVVSGRNVV